VAIISIRLSFLDNMLEFFKLGNESYNVLLDANGTIAIHPMKKYADIDPHKKTTSDLGFNMTTKHNKKNDFFDTIRIDSIGKYQCPNSLALSYFLHNDWRLLTVFSDDILPISF
jgi:hypothetical protein